MSKIMTYPMPNCSVMRINYEKNRIDTQPEYQRQGEIWNLEKKQLLIDSILNDYDIPKIYFHQLNKSRVLPNGREVFYSIIDGRQRLETIWGFMDEAFPLSDDFVFYRKPDLNAAGMRYSELSKRYPELKVIFDSYALPIICVETDNIELIEEMFSRLNEAVPLNAAEKRNAMGGVMAKTITNVSLHSFFRNKVKFLNKRYQHKEVAARILFLEDSVSKHRLIDTKKVYLDNFVKSYKKGSLNPKPIQNRVEVILAEMNHVFYNKDDLLAAQANIPIYYLLFRQAIDQKKLANLTRHKLNNFKQTVVKNRTIAEIDISKAEFDLLEFDRLSIQGTNDASSIKERLRIICRRFDIQPLGF